MHEKGIGGIPDAVLHARFILLPDEYSLVNETLQAMRNRDRDEIIRMISTRHSNLPQKKGAQRSSRQPEQAFVSSECGSRSGARRDRDRRGRGRQGRGRGGSSCGGVGNNNSSGTSSGSTAEEGESGEGAPSQGGGRVEEDLDGESDLDVTEVGPMLTGIRKTETEETGAGAGGVAEGDPAASSDSPGSNSTSTSRGNVPKLAGREAHRQRWDGKIPAFEGGRTRSQSRQHQMSADTADALLTHARRTEEEDTATDRVHDLLLEGRLEEEHEGLGEMMEWLEEDGPALERREEAQDPDCPLAMAAEQDPEISTAVPIGKQPSEVESPPLRSRSRTVCVPEVLGRGHGIRVRWPY